MTAAGIGAEPVRRNPKGGNEMEETTLVATEVEVEADELEFDRETLSDYLAMAHRC